MSHLIILLLILSETVCFKSDNKTIQEVKQLTLIQVYVFNSALKQYIYRCTWFYFLVLGYKHKNILLEKKILH